MAVPHTVSEFLQSYLLTRISFPVDRITEFLPPVAPFVGLNGVVSVATFVGPDGTASAAP